MTDMTDNLVRVEIANGVGVVTMNRPEQLNALTADLLRQLQAELRKLGEDDNCRSVVLAGAGRAFCAGLDLSSVTSPGAPASPDGTPTVDMYY